MSLPLRTGLSFALTIAVLYLGCLLLMLVAPGAVLWIFSTWVHGLNLEPITSNAPPIDATRAVLGLFLISGYAFIAGVVYGAIRKRLGS